MEKEPLRSAALPQSPAASAQNRSRGLQCGPNCHDQISHVCHPSSGDISLALHSQSLDLSCQCHVRTLASYQLPGHEAKPARLLNLLLCFISKWRALTWLHTTGEQLRAC